MQTASSSASLTSSAGASAKRSRSRSLDSLPRSGLSGRCLREEIAERQAHPQRYAGEQSVMHIYLQAGALEKSSEEDVVGLLTMTLMAAVFNTQADSWL